MSVLSNLANRLQTDLADTARAVADVSFSERMTEDYYNEKDFSRKALEERRQREADMAFRSQEAQKQRSWAAALDFGNKLFDTALDSGTGSQAWNAFAEYATNKNLPPELASYFGTMNSAQGTKTFDQLKFEHQMKLDYDKLDLDEQELMFKFLKHGDDHDIAESEVDLKERTLRQRANEFAATNEIAAGNLSLRADELRERTRQFTEQEKRLFMQFRLDEREQAYKEMQTLKEEGITNTMKWKLVGMIDEVKGMDAAEKQSFKDRLENVDINQHQLDQVWDELMSRHRLHTENEAREARARIAADRERELLVTDPGTREIELVRGHLQNNEDFQKLPEDQKEAMANWGSFHVNYLSRKLGKNQVDVAKQAADAALSGLSKDGDFFESMKESVFQPLKADGKPPPGIPDSYIDKAMEQNPEYTRKQIVDALWKQYEEEVDY